jgi:hypothetical protein
LVQAFEKLLPRQNLQQFSMLVSASLSHFRQEDETTMLCLGCAGPHAKMSEALAVEALVPWHQLSSFALLQSWRLQLRPERLEHLNHPESQRVLQDRGPT